MRLLHPVDSSRSKDVPDALVEKYLNGGWTKAVVERAPVKKTAPKPSPKK